MSRKFDTALAGLRDTYPSPDPARMKEFLRSLPSNQREDASAVPPLHTGRKPMWFALPAVVAAAVMLTVGIGVYRRNPPHTVPSIVETSTTYTETVTDVNSTELPSETTAASSLTAAESQTTVTGAASTAATSPTTAAVTTRSAVSGDSTATSTLTPVRTTASTPAVTSPAEHTAIVPTEPGIAANTAHTTAGTSAATEKRSTFTIVRETTTTKNIQTTQITQTSQKPAGTTTRTTTTTIATTYTGNSAVSPAVESEDAAPAEDIPPNAVPQVQEFPVALPAVRYDVPAQYETWNDFYESSDAGETESTASETWRSAAESADAVVIGRVTDICYTSFNGYPYTVYSVYADEVCKGGYVPGALTVWQLGGYIPLPELTEHFNWVRERTASMTASEIAETMIFENAPQPLGESDGTLLLFLRVDDMLPPGAFCTLDCMTLDGGIFRAADGTTLSIGEVYRAIQ